jgi:hypothetical protein
VFWSTGAITASITVNPTTTTTYTATCTVGTCKGTATGKVTVNPKPTPLVNSATICEGESATLTATNCSGTISWNTGTTTASITVNPTATTTYTATCTVGTCKGTATGKVTVNPKPTPSVNDATICAGESATLTATNCAGNISWNTGATTASITVNPTGTTTYTATCTVGTCKGTDTGKVTVNPKPTPSVNSATICEGESATLTVTNCSGTISWNTGATTASITVSPITSSTTYTATCTVGTCKGMASGIVTVKPKPTITVGTQICNTALTQVTIPITVNAGTTLTSGSGCTVSGTSPNYTVTMTPSTTCTLTATGLNSCKTTQTVTSQPCNCPAIAPPTVPDNSICSGATAALTTPGCATESAAKWYSDGGLTSEVGSGNSFTTPALTQNATYYVACVSTTAAQCKSTGTKVAVTINPNPTPSVNDATICEGESATLTVTNCSGTVSWNTGATTASITVNSTKTATYTATCTVGTCKGTDTGKVTVNPKPTPSVNDATICEGESAMLTVTNCAGSISWNTGATTPSITVNPTPTTTYTATCTLTTGCKGTDTGKVTVNPKPTPSVNDATICKGESATLTATNCAGSISWNTGATTTSITVNPTTTTTYTATCTVGTCKGTDTGKVTVNSLPSPVVNSPTICKGESATLTVTNCSGAVSWNTGITTASITVSPTTTTTYTATCTLTSGCKDNVSAIVTVNPLPAPEVDSPTICKGEKATLDVTNCTGTVTWADGGTGNIRVVIPTVTTTHIATCTLAPGCKATVDAKVNVNPLPTITIDPAGTITCSPDLKTYTVPFKATTGATVTVDKGTVSGSTVTGVLSGETVTIVADLNGCKDTLSVTKQCTCPVINPPTGSNKEICQGDALPALTVTVDTGLEANWYAVATGGTVLKNGLSYTPTTTGDYYVEAINPISKCKSTTRIKISLIPNPKPTLTADAVCSADGLKYDVTVSTNAVSITSDKGTVSGMKVLGVTAGQTVTITATSSKGCKTTIMVTKACIQPKGSLGDYVWKDGNNDGLQGNVLDIPVKGVILELYKNGTATGKKDTTDAAGLYLFTNLDSASYQVKIIGGVPLGLQISPKKNIDGNVSETKDSDFDPTTGLSDAVIIDPTNPTGTAKKDNLDVDAALYSSCITPHFKVIDKKCVLSSATYSVTFTVSQAGVVKINQGTLSGSGIGPYTVTNIPSGVNLIILDSLSVNCKKDTTIISVICNCPSVSTVTNNLVICKGDTFPTLKAVIVGTGATTIEWYAAATGGLPLFTGLNYKPTGVATTNTTYFVTPAGLVGICAEQARTAVTINVQDCSKDEVDLALKKMISKKLAQVGDVITYTLKVWNESNKNATGVEVTDSLNVGVQYLSSVASRGNYDINTKKWRIGNVAPNGDTVTLTIQVKVLMEGIWFNTAEISKTNEKDRDSTPGNKKDGEDDIDRQCFTVPIKLCTTEKVEVSVPVAYTGVVWSDGQQGNVASFSAAGTYTFTATNGSCPAGGCCPIVIEVKDCCPANICVPFTITRKRAK